ncbi:MAG: hypothetical protein JW852_01055, partial [Spirochaetales bacterium]|nr:hypothetical protein [Spirochaetales bacterium]
MNREIQRLLAVLVLAALTTAGAFSDDLWERTLAIAQDNQVWLAGDITINTQQLNGRGKVLDEGSTIISRSITSAGTLEESIRQLGNAPPDPENILSGGIGLPKALRSGEGSLSLFDPNRQGDLSLSREHGTERLPGGVEAVVYQYSQQLADGEVVRGRVWIDLETGVTIKLKTIPEKAPPPMVGSTTVVHFNTSASRWYPIRVEMAGVARRAMIKREVEMTVVLENYT